jgi:hypothetical protein
MQARVPLQDLDRAIASHRARVEEEENEEEVVLVL